MKKAALFLTLTTIILGIFISGAKAQTAINSKIVTQGIERKVFKKLLGFSYHGMFELTNYQIDDTVILNGKVAETANKKNAENTIENCEVLPQSPFDNSIRNRSLKTFAIRGAEIFRYVQGPNPSVKLIIDSGYLILESVADDFRPMNITAKGISDIFSVKKEQIC